MLEFNLKIPHLIYIGSICLIIYWTQIIFIEKLEQTGGIYPGVLKIRTPKVHSKN
jgi:hypothetical protein